MLLSLPRELRIQIYEELFCRPGGLCLEYHHESKKICQSSLSPENRAHLGILPTCRTIYSEARQTLYGSTTFVIMKAYPQSILSFFKSLAPEDRDSIKSMTFHDPVPLPSFVTNFLQWRDLSAYLTTVSPPHHHLRTITLRPSVESGLFAPDTFHPVPTSYHHPQDCWWPPARAFVSLLMAPDAALKELRLQYTAYRNPRTGQVAAFWEEGWDMDVEKLFAVRMLRIPRTEADEVEEGEKLEELKTTGSVGIRVRAYNEEILRRGKEGESHGFTVTRREVDMVGGLRSVALLLRPGDKVSEA